MASGFSLNIANIAVSMLRWCGDNPTTTSR